MLFKNNKHNNGLRPLLYALHIHCVLTHFQTHQSPDHTFSLEKQQRREETALGHYMDPSLDPTTHPDGTLSKSLNLCASASSSAPGE